MFGDNFIKTLGSVSVVVVLFFFFSFSFFQNSVSVVDVSTITYQTKGSFDD